MQIFKEIEPLRAFLIEKRQHGNSIGLVPTMGALHQGHLALIEASRQRGLVTVCSVFVNPAQFNNPDDLQHYPRTPERDLQLLKSAGCDVVFIPSVEVMYPQPAQLSFVMPPFDQVMEGKFRPGHFSGVALVVSKLFHLIQPDASFFGQKDFQQAAVIKHLVEQLSFQVQIHVVPTVREKDGLAMSSRNERLTAEQRSVAPEIYRAMVSGREMLAQGSAPEEVKEIIRQQIDRTAVLKTEYVEIVHKENLMVVQHVYPAQAVICVAVHAGAVRLIDNLIV